MTQRTYVFTDESGDFTFRPDASRYFIIGSVAMSDCTIGEELLELRRELAWDGVSIEAFHASNDKRWVRDRVFDIIAAHGDLRCDATLLEKPKTQPHLASNHIRFYKTAMYLHFKYVVPRITERKEELAVVTSSLQIKRKKKAVHEAVKDVVDQVSPTRKFVTSFFQASADPCLQVADYVTWAIQRKFERGDLSAYEKVEHLVRTEFEPFARGTTTYY